MPDDLLQAFNRSVASVLTADAEDLLTLARAGNLDPRTDFRGADLRGLDLSGEDLRDFDLSGADLTGANLTDADLRGVNLSRAILRNATLTNARMSGSILTDAVLEGADLADSDRSRAPDPHQAEETRHAILLGEDSTLDLVRAARAGDSISAEALMARCLPALKRWTHGRIPLSLRGKVDEDDIVQEAAVRVLRRLDTLEPRHVGAMQAYLRATVDNTIRDQIRVASKSADADALALDDGAEASPLEAALKAETYDRYRRALDALSARDRDLVIARVETQWSYREIAERFTLQSADGARTAIGRAMTRLVEAMSKAR